MLLIMWIKYLQSEFMAKDQCVIENDLPAITAFELKSSIGFSLRVSYSFSHIQPTSNSNKFSDSLNWTGASETQAVCVCNLFLFLRMKCACEILFRAKSRDKFDFQKAEKKKTHQTHRPFLLASLRLLMVDLTWIKGENIWLCLCFSVRCLKPVQHAHTQFSYNKWHFIFRWGDFFSTAGDWFGNLKGSVVLREQKI